MASSVWMVLLLMGEAASAEIIKVSAGGGVLLPSDPPMQLRWDVRWTHPHLLLTKNRTAACRHGRCELLSNGSLRFSRVQAGDAGNYTLEVFDEGGRLLRRRDFLLQVEDVSSSVGGSASIYCLLLLFLVLIIIIIFILRRRRRSQRTTITGHKEENVYVVMHGRRGNKEKEEAVVKQEEEAESLYVPCHPPASMETPITEQEAEDVYV